MASRNGAWKEAPEDYLARRPASFSAPARPRSTYVVMRDGCRLAVDAYIPIPLDDDRAGKGRFPAIVLLTPYYRRFKLKPDAPAGSEGSPSTLPYRQTFVPRGYAVVVVDVRGTGASSGSRDSFRSPAERDDFRELADWIVAQSWSDGTIGSTGVSYLGAAATFLASTGHPAVKAVAPMFAVWDTYSDHYYPGGAHLHELARTYDELMVALDHNRADLLERFPAYCNPAFDGPAPVDDDGNGSHAARAVSEHLANFRMPEFITEFRFRDDTLPYDPAFGTHSFSPQGYAAGIADGVAIYSISGWWDGGGFSNGAITRYLSLETGPRHLLLGPWDHGAKVHVSPWRSELGAGLDLQAELLRFFDTYVLGMDTGLRNEAPVHFYSIHSEAWHSADQWPPTPTTVSLAVAADGRLAESDPAEGEMQWTAVAEGGTGRATRYERLSASSPTEYYPDWHERSSDMLHFHSDVLQNAILVAGHPSLDIELTCSEPDGIISAYLSEVDEGGRARYVTESVLRLLHRDEATPSQYERTCYPYRSFHRSMARPMKPGVFESIRLALLPVAWEFRPGSRIRVSFASTDVDHFAHVPYGRLPTFRIKLGQTRSQLTLPLLEQAPTPLFQQTSTSIGKIR